ncbi:Secondary metabolism regulator LAE1 [Colletotrichum sp. SAR 10_96]|nr:Secondary metabolism regulator LAE1 [Colletotrichum sp. SAR 10_96]
MATPGADSATTAGEPPEFIEVGDTATPEEASEPEDWDARSSTSTSLASGIQRHAFANGRRYLGNGRYVNGSVKIPRRSTGAEMIDSVGDQYPGAEVTGADLSPIQPDCNLKPGAWVETQDFNSNVNCDDGTMPDDWALIKFWALLHEAMLKLNVDIRVAPQIGELMEQAGFVNVRKTAYKVPIGTWPRNNILNLVGEYMRTIMEDLLGAAASKPLKTLGMTDTEIQVFLVSVRSALRDRNVHAYGTYYSWVGQKPLDA